MWTDPVILKWQPSIASNGTVGVMEPYEFRVVVKAGTAEYQDMSGLLDRMLADICREGRLHPIAALMAALALFKQRRE